MYGVSHPEVQKNGLGWVTPCIEAQKASRRHKLEKIAGCLVKEQADFLARLTKCLLQDRFCWTAAVTAPCSHWSEQE